MDYMSVAVRTYKKKIAQDLYEWYLPAQGQIQADMTDARAAVKKICLNYFWSASSK